ncbi:MAG TPA: tetratricopeptide repeat protein [Bryobacteraceae bacterium]|nr:tetratricopeptide repeat protein [Bryobacteraceae bacterium]
MRLRNLFLSTLAVLSFALASYAQTTAVEGNVIGEDGKPLAGAMVHLTRTDIKGNYKVKTDKKGHYFYGGLPIGEYNIAVEVNGKEVASLNKVRTHPGDPLELPPFDLQAQAKQHQAQQAAAQQAAATGQAIPKEVERGMSAEQKAAYEKAVKEREDAMKKNKALNDAFNTGLQALEAKNYDAAITSLKSASEMDPKQLAVWTHLADAYILSAASKTGADQQTAYQNGLDAYGKALELSPADAGIHNNYGLALVKAKKLPEAQAELNKAAELDPTNAAKYYFNLGAVLVNTGQNDAAGEAFKKAIAANPNYADAQYQYGVYLVAKAQITSDGKVNPVPGTREAFEKYLELQPNGPYAESAKGMLASMSSAVDTKYKNPNETKKSKKK